MNVSRDGRIDLETVKYVEDGADIRIQLGDVLFNNTNSPELVGKTAFFDRAGDWAYSNHMTRLRPSREIDGQFLAIQLHWLWMTGFYKTILNNHVNQASVATKNLLANVRVVVPPHAEQRRIVAAIEEHLSRLDAAVGLVRNAASRLDGLRGSVIDSAFVASWPRVPLGEIAEVVGGVTKDSKRQEDPGLVEVPYLRVANVQRGFLDLETVTPIRVSPKRAAKLELRPGDVLFNEGGDRDKLGRGWVWSGEIPGCIHQNHVFRARLRDGFDPRFVSWWGNSFGREWFWVHGRQTTNLASMSLSTLKAFPVPAPPLDDQRAAVAEIERRLSALDHLAHVIGALQARAARLRQSILARAFWGELVPQDASDEPASVLLERIAAERVASPPPTRKRRVRTPA
jgi:type I restriction enzyme S subunit